MWKVIGQSGKQHKMENGISLCGIPASNLKDNANNKKCDACIGRNGGKH